MAKSVRISDEIYELASHEAGLMHRSLAQQLEYWVKLGVGVAHGQATLDDVRAAAVKYKQVRDEAQVRQGKRAANSLHFIPADVARAAKVKAPKGAFASRRKSW
jgi:hypothetical protein